MTEEKKLLTPAQLAEIRALADLPVPWCGECITAVKKLGGYVDYDDDIRALLSHIDADAAEIEHLKREFDGALIACKSWMMHSEKLTRERRGQVAEIAALKKANAEQAGEIEYFKTGYEFECKNVAHMGERNAAQATEIAALRKQLAEADAVIAAGQILWPSLYTVAERQTYLTYEDAARARHRARAFGEKQ